MMASIPVTQRWLSEFADTPSGKILVEWITGTLQRPLESVTNVEICYMNEFTTQMQADFADGTHATWPPTLQLVPYGFVSPEDEEVRRLLTEHPLLRFHLTWLVNGYRELAKTVMQDTDTADTGRSLAKKDSVARRMGIELLDTSEQWDAFSEARP